MKRLFICLISLALFLTSCITTAEVATPDETFDNSTNIPLPKTDWLALGSPSEIIIELVGGQFFSLYGRSEQGNLWECKTYRAANGEDCWKEVSILPEFPDFVYFVEGSEGANTSSLPAKVKQLFEVHEIQDDGEMINIYVLLEDHTVWKLDSCC